VMLVMVRGVVPPLVNVTRLELLVVPMSRVAKVREPGDTVTAEVPVPLRLTACGLPAALSVTCSEAVRVPRPVGVNCTLMVQFEPAAKVAPHVVVRENSALLAPVNPMLLIVSGALPVLVRVTTCAELVVPTR